MTAKYRAAALSTEDGWTEVIDNGFIALVGPFYTRTDGGHIEVAVVCQDKHRNRRGIVQGGLVMTFADRALGIAARAHSGAPTTATVHLDVHFVAPVHVGDVLRARPHTAPGTRSLLFMRTDLTVEDTLVATATGVFKPLRTAPLVDE
ncbi:MULTISPECIES: PaaI family thioesterase [Rhodococcus]|uniref:Possible thioesterase n=1 Tax=Rhodococcus jostii (strain RHA1) TaxID=101510 RepID=Q0S163_RHOJR|nr:MULTISPECIES: PaaI family thioesterase [Rhodococcus]ABG98723.1 possible thioesterase [Rhodococcus jostii RHA1]